MVSLVTVREIGYSGVHVVRVTKFEFHTNRKDIFGGKLGTQ